MAETIVEPTARTQAFFKSKKYDRALFMKAATDSGGIRLMVAQRLGVESTTIKAWERKFPEVAEKLTEEREKILDLAEHALFGLIRDKDPWAIGFVLRTIGKSRGYIEKQEISHTQSQPVQLIFEDSAPTVIEDNK